MQVMIILENHFLHLWNCSNAIKKDGLAILVAECKFGLGSDAIQQYIEDRLTLEQLKILPNTLMEWKICYFFQKYKRIFKLV